MGHSSVVPKLYASFAVRVSRGTYCTGVGLGALDEAAATIMDDLVDTLIRRFFARVCISPVRAGDDPLRSGRMVRAHF